MTKQIDQKKLKDDLAFLYKNTKSQDQFRLAGAKSTALSQSKTEISFFWPVTTLSSLLLALLIAPPLLDKSNNQIVVSQVRQSSIDIINEEVDQPIFYYWLDVYDNELIAANEN
ncbi:MAG TPA: hypothetical protein DCX08_07840 [Porticoccaceae bacterium]|nr:hypothetical protein [Porticoccaceae bacterium]